MADRRARASRRAAADSPAERRAVRARRVTALALLALLAAAGAVAVVIAGGGSAGDSPVHRTAASLAAGTSHLTGAARSVGGPTPRRSAVASQQSSFAVGLRVVRLIDRTRTIVAADGRRVPRPLLTYVRYPALGASGAADLPDATPARAAGPFPLVVFGHGFAVTPTVYSRLLRSWARAGYVVAAPVFPLGNADAPRGPDESDLPNQPADMRFVISRMLAAGRATSGPFGGLIDGAGVAVAGQSDGGDTALAAAYDPRLRDTRVKAAVILSGAEIPSLGSFTFPPRGPALLATQGTADTINLPSETATFFRAAHAPKYLLRLLGAEHLPPYTVPSPQSRIVERVTRAFLDAYLKHRRGSLGRLSALGNVTATAELLAQP